MLDWQGRKRAVMTGRKWTELFFLDEATAMAAGHRPCGYCRRADYASFVDAWTTAAGSRPSAKAMDQALHKARIIKGTRQQLRHQMAFADLPDGAMIWHDDAPALVWHKGLYPYTPEGYRPPLTLPKLGLTEVLTPQPMIAALQAGFRPTVHPTARL